MKVQMQHQAESVATAMMRGCLGVRVGRLQRLVSRRFDQSLRPLGLSVSHLEVLSALTLWNGPARPSELAEMLAIERSTMSRNLALMEAKGLIHTSETSATGRTMAVTITDAGSTALVDVRAVWTMVQNDLATLVGGDAAETLDAWLSALTA